MSLDHYAQNINTWSRMVLSVYFVAAVLILPGFSAVSSFPSALACRSQSATKPPSHPDTRLVGK